MINVEKVVTVCVVSLLQLENERLTDAKTDTPTMMFLILAIL
jgi:hypothetical protein